MGMEKKSAMHFTMQVVNQSGESGKEFRSWGLWKSFSREFCFSESGVSYRDDVLSEKYVSPMR
jgi:hypothetical protein